MKGHEPHRLCIVCRKQMNKKDLIRLVNREGVVQVDRDAKMAGRGAYSCIHCIDLVKKNKNGCLNRAFRTGQRLVFKNNVTAY